MKCSIKMYLPKHILMYKYVEKIINKKWTKLNFKHSLTMRAQKVN